MLISENELISISDIPSEHMQLVAERCGIADAISLMEKCPGLEIYVPISGQKNAQNKFIKENFNGTNASSLAVSLGIDRAKVIYLSKKNEKDISDEIPTSIMKIVARECGKSIAIRLMEHLPKHTLYVPKDGFIIAKKSYIMRKFDGSNVAELALKCKMTERFVRKVIADMYSSRYQQRLELFS